MIRIALTALCVLLAACASDYEFRSDDRPSYDRAVTVDELPANAAVLDVRLKEDFDADPVLLPGATYRDPDKIELWAKNLSPGDGPVVVYCVRGKWVSQKAATYLADEGFDVYTMEGGIEAWKARGRDVEAAN